MRLLTFLLSIYILLITMTPCHCDDDCTADRTEQNQILTSLCLQQINNADDKHNCENCQDRCTPFCCCANQHIASIMFYQINFYQTPITSAHLHAVLNSQYTEKKYSAYHTSHKNPPEA